MNNELLDPQNEIHALARVTPDEVYDHPNIGPLPECWGGKLDRGGEDYMLDSYYESRFDME